MTVKLTLCRDTAETLIPAIISAIERSEYLVSMAKTNGDFVKAEDRVVALDCLLSALREAVATDQ
jgi:hypothetical protein